MAHISRTGFACHRNFRGSALPATIAVVLAVALLSAAGAWQLHRAHYKDALQAKAAAAMHDGRIEMSDSPVRGEDVDFHAINVRGEWVADKTIFLDNKIRDGKVGYFVLTPLRIGNGKLHVLVNRGWVAAPPLRTELPAVVTPAGSVSVTGIARLPGDRFLELSDQTKEGEQGRVWQNLTIDRFRAWSGLSLQPVVIYQQDVSEGNLQRVEIAPETAVGLSADRHRGYALTWFSLAVVTLALAITAKLKSSSHGQKT